MVLAESSFIGSCSDTASANGVTRFSFKLGLITNKRSDMVDMTFEYFRIVVSIVGIKPKSQGFDKTREIFVWH